TLRRRTSQSVDTGQEGFTHFAGSGQAQSPVRVPAFRKSQPQDPPVTELLHEQLQLPLAHVELQTRIITPTHSGSGGMPRPSSVELHQHRLPDALLADEILAAQLNRERRVGLEVFHAEVYALFLGRHAAYRSAFVARSFEGIPHPGMDHDVGPGPPELGGER